LNKYKEEWYSFRANELWTIEINDLMEPNIPGLKLLYESFFEPRKKFMDLKDCKELFWKKTQILNNEKDVTFCYGMSKMTVINEQKDGKVVYNKLSFVEFIEMVGRVANLKYANNPEFSKLNLC
jgi:hypothetical protein